MPRHDTIKHYGHKYTVYAPDEVLLNEQVRCPKCNSDVIVYHGEEMVQHGIEYDMTWDFASCGECEHRICIRDTAPAETTQSYIAWLEAIEEEMTKDIPF